MVKPRRNWTVEEDAILRQVVRNATSSSRPLLWREAAKHIPGRSNKDCRKRWWNTLADGITKGPWSEEEDESLIEAVASYGMRWNEVSRRVGSRNPDQCSSHWSQVLDPDINYCDWSTQEDKQLLHEVLSYGTNWSTITVSHNPKRTALALKNRYSTLRLRNQTSRSRQRELVASTTSSSPSINQVLGEDSEAANINTGAGAKSRRAFEDEEDDEEDEEDEGETMDQNQGGGEFEDGDEDEDCLPNSSTPNEGSINALSHNKDHTPPSDMAPELGTHQWTGLNNLSQILNCPVPAPGTAQWMSDLNAGNGTDFLDSIHDTNMSFNDAIPHFPDTSPGYSHRESSIAAQSLDNSSVKETGSATSPGSDEEQYHVTIDMSCTTAQLKNLMAWLVQAGSGVSVKIGDT